MATDAMTAESGDADARLASALHGTDGGAGNGNAVLDLSPLARLAKDGFTAALDTIAEAKTLLIDPSLAGPLGLVSDVATLKQHGVEKMFWLEGTQGPAVRVYAPTRQVMYFCRPEARWMRVIAGVYRRRAGACTARVRRMRNAPDRN